MRTSFIFFLLFLPAFLTTPFIANCQDLKLTQLPVLQDATWLVTGIAQDPQGYMWFGTKRTGLYRYDGYNIVSYKNQPSNANSLSYDAIESLHADNKGIIWIGTFGRGLDRFDPASGNFTHFRFARNDASSLPNDTVTAILEDRKGNLWIGSYGGISRLDQKSGKFTSYYHEENNSSSLSCNQVRTIYQDRQGTIWVGTGSAFHENYKCNLGGLNKLDINSGKFTRYLHDPGDENSLIDNRVRAIFEDKYGTFYVGTAGDGLHTMDRKTGKFTRHLYDPQHPEKLSRPPLRNNLGYVDDHITFINEDITGSVWIGTFAGLNRYDPATKKVKYYKFFNDSTEVVKDNIGWMGFTSRDGVLWFSALGKGNIYYVDPFLKKIDHYDLGDQVNCMYQESPGVIWLGTQLTGLIRKDRASGTQKGFLFPTITAIRSNNQGKYWIGTIEGLFLFDPKTGTSVPYKPASNNNGSNEFVVSCLYVSSNENLWIGTSQGLYYLNTQTGSFTSYRHLSNDTSSLSDNSVSSVLEDKQGRLWVGTFADGGINLLDQHKEKFSLYLKGRGITGTIYQDFSGTIWAGTHDGLYRFNPAKNNFIPFTDINTGGSFNFILNLLADDQYNLWIVTGTELIKVNQHRNAISRFGRNEGVKPNTGYWGNFSGGNGQEVFYGDQSGYYIFNPSSLAVNSIPPQILITDFGINGHQAKAGLNDLLNKDQQIKLKHNENFFFFNLLAIHYSNPANNRLIYMLENYDDTWREAGVGQRAYYFNVPPGHYILRVKAANGNGVWAQKNIAFTITPPWWQTWWAYLLAALLFVGCIWYIIFSRSRKLIAEKKLLEEKVNLRTKEVVHQKEEISVQRDKLEEALQGLQNTQIQLIQREKMASLGELTAGIAHEIQNPLNFVKNFSEVNIEMLDEMDEAIARGDISDAKNISADIKQNLEKIIHHGKRADSIVKGMLHHSRKSTNNKEPTNINDLADECLRLTYHGLRAKDKTFNASFETNFNESIKEINVIPQDIGRVFLNLFTNAFYSVIEKQKQHNENYEPKIIVTTKRLHAAEMEGGAEIRIKDNGLGIPQKVLDKIFQPFFTTKPTGEGTGLGLSLSYDIIKAHGGEIKVETKDNEGAEFIIQLPPA